MKAALVNVHAFGFASLVGTEGGSWRFTVQLEQAVRQKMLDLKKVQIPQGQVLVVRILESVLSDPMLLEQCQQELARLDSSKPIVLDMSALAYVGSSFMGALLHMHRQAQAQGGAFVLFGVKESFEHVMRVLKLEKLFRVADTMEEAIQAAVAGARSGKSG